MTDLENGPVFLERLGILDFLGIINDDHVSSLEVVQEGVIPLHPLRLIDPLPLTSLEQDHDSLKMYKDIQLAE